MSMLKERIQSTWNQANNSERVNLAKYLEVARDITLIVQCKWDELYSIERKQLSQLIQDNIGIRCKDNNSYPNIRFEFEFNLECNDEGRDEVVNQFNTWLQSKNWAFKTVSINTKYL